MVRNRLFDDGGIERYQIDDTNWVDLKAVGTEATSKEYSRLKDSGMFGNHAFLAARIVNWNIAQPGPDGKLVSLPFDKALIPTKLANWLVVELVTFLNELDEKERKENGTDNPKN